MFSSMDTVQDRLRYYRETIRGVSLRDFQAAINARLPEEDGLSLGTISNYEKPGSPGSRRPGPRVEFLTALKAAYPEVRLDWVIFGDGQPTDVGELLASPEGLDEAGGGGFGARVLERYPDIELLPPEGSALFMAALTRLAMGEPDKALDEDLLLELAGDLRWLLFFPARLWGFLHDPPYEVFADYSVAMLHALMQLMPPPGRGDGVEEYAASPTPGLRTEYPVGF